MSLIANVIFSTIVFFLSAILAIHAQEQRLFLCEGDLSYKLRAQKCVEELYYKKHVVGHHGAKAYFSDDSKTIQKALKFLKDNEDIISNNYLAYNFTELIEGSRYIILMINLEDMPNYHLYVINPYESRDQKVQLVAQIYHDWFDLNLDSEIEFILFGLKEDQKFKSYIY